MQTQVLFMLVLSCLSFSCATSMVWFWYVPVVRASLHRPVEPLLKRVGQIGFDEAQFRNALFAIECLFLIALGWSTFTYLEPVLGLTLFGIGVHVRSLILAWIIDSRERLLREQTLALTAGLQGLVRGGLGLTLAVESIARETPVPLGRQIRRTVLEFRRGRPLVEAIDEVRSTLRLDAFSLMVTSLTCALRQGSSLEASLAGVQEALEHRDQAERQLRAKTSSARSTILILACTPPGFFLMFWYMMPDSMALIFTTREGKIMLAVILGFLYVGIAWARRLLAIK